MRRPCLKIWICTVVCLLLPLQAFATICWTDGVNQYFVELGSSSRGTIALSGYVKVGTPPDKLLPPCQGFDLIAPLVGTAVVVDSNTAVIGWLVTSIDNANGCIGYRERLTLDLHTGNLDGEYYLDSDGSSGDDHLTLFACPKSHGEGNQNPLKRFDK
jgi:hypothetical protein